MKRIAITINLKVSSLFSNGINQNAIYLANLLKEIGYSVYLVHVLEDDVDDIVGIKTISLKKAFNIPFDLVFQFGFTMHQPIMDIFKTKNKNIKLVAYECGNKYIIDMESILFKPDKDTVIEDRAKPHQIWSIPQMENSNLDYYKFLNRQERATVVPFIWEPLAIEDHMQEKGYSLYTERNLNRIVVLEANISVMKNILLPIVAIDKYYKDHKHIEKVVLYGTDHIKTNKTFMSIINRTKMAKDKKVFANPRENTVDVLNTLGDVVFSWQWENNLNYLWLDAAWMGWPVVHNGNLCQDVGYYYDGFNVDMGVEVLKNAIENHNKDVDYLERNRKTIERYTHKNEKLKEQYKILVENVLNNKFEKYSYDWKTNLIL